MNRYVAKQSRHPSKSTARDIPISRERAGLVAVAIAVLSLVLYASQLNGSFILDDFSYFVYNPYLDNLRTMVDWEHFQMHRPLYWLSFAIQKSWFQDQPLGYKLTNLFSHVLAAWFFYKFSRTLLQLKPVREGSFAVVATFLFVASPLAVEPIAYISGRNNSFGAAFFMLGGYLLLRGLKSESSRGRMLHFAFALLAFIGAVLFKEIYLAFLFFCPALLWWILKPTRKTQMTIAAVSIISILILAAAMYVAPRGPLLRMKRAAIRTLSMENASAISTNANAIAYSFRLFAFPDRLNIDHDVPVLSGFQSPWAWIGPGVILALGILFFLLRGHLPLSFPAYLSYLILIAPSNSLILRRGDWMIDPLSERNLYMPAMFFSIILADILYALLKDPKVRRYAAVVMIAALSIRTGFRASDFRSEISLWEAAYQYSPDRPRVPYNLAVGLKNNGQPGEALPYARAALKLSPQIQCFGLVASLEEQTGDVAGAQATLDRGIRSCEGDTSVLLNQLGQLYYKQQKWAKARTAFEQGAEMNGMFVQPLISLLYIDLAEGDILSAGKRIETVERRLARTSAQFRSTELIDSQYRALFAFGRGWYLIDTGKVDTGIRELIHATELNPGLIEPYLKLGEHYYRTGNYPEAWDWFLRASRQAGFQRYTQQAGPYMRNLPKLLENPDLDPGIN